MISSRTFRLPGMVEVDRRVSRMSFVASCQTRTSRLEIKKKPNKRSSNLVKEQRGDDDPYAGDLN